MRLETLYDLYIEQLKDLHSAERQLRKRLPDLAAHAKSPQLRDRLESSVEEVESELTRLQSLAGSGVDLTGETCKGMTGLLDEAEDLVSECVTEEVRDAALIAGIQRIKHYEIAGYGCARAYAEQLGKDDEAERLGEILDEEAEENERLTELATETINEAAVDKSLA